MAGTMDPLPQHSSFSIAPQTQISHMRTNSTNPAAATRALHSQRQPPLSAPASQESFASVQSVGSSVAGASSASQVTNYTDADLTSPELRSGRGSDKHAEEVPRVRTPDETQVGGLMGFGSPMSIVTTPMNANCAKRTASGHVKNAPSLPTSPTVFTGRHSRGDSLSSTGSRAGELAASLKTRLGYAMAKVQNGWEHRSIAEVEQLAAHKVLSPNNRYSMSHLQQYGEQHPPASGHSNGTLMAAAYDQQYAVSSHDRTRSPPPKRQSGSYAHFIAASPQYHYSSNAPCLQPPADIHALPGSSIRQTYAHTHHSPAFTSAMSPPRTPSNGRRRPQPLRTDTQTAQAERDAVQALFELGSPHAAQVSRRAGASQDSSNQGSPLKSDFAPTPRKVTFASSDSASGDDARHSSVDSASLGSEARSR